MKDADMSAYPIIGATLDGNEGLTKREYFAGLAMQGILANKCYEAPRRDKISGMAVDAVLAADELIQQLDY